MVEEGGEQEINSLPSKYHGMWVSYFFSCKGEVERGRKNKGREEGGREEVKGEGDTISAECLGHYP